MAEVKIAFNSHGKGRVRIVKVVRKPDGTHDVIQLNVQIALEGDTMDDAFYTGSNAQIVPTDTCKNTVYCLAKKHSFKTIEEFGVILARHFITEFPQFVNRATIDIVKDDWQRVKVPNSAGQVAGHKHAFQRMGPKCFYTKVVGEKRGTSPASYQIRSGLRGLEVLKTTQSGFIGFNKCQFTSLPELTDRLLGTSVTCEWDFNTRALNFSTDFDKIASEVENALITTFAGPADKGVYSPSVQLTLYEMGHSVLRVHPSIDKVCLYMPNIHNMVFPVNNYGLELNDSTGQPDIFYPIDEPHGMIKAEVVRCAPGTGKAKL